MDYAAQVEDIQNPEGFKYRIIGSKVTAVLPDRQIGCTAETLISVLANQPTLHGRGQSTGLPRLVYWLRCSIFVQARNIVNEWLEHLLFLKGFPANLSLYQSD